MKGQNNIHYFDSVILEKNGKKYSGLFKEMHYAMNVNKFSFIKFPMVIHNVIEIFQKCGVENLKIKSPDFIAHARIILVEKIENER